MRECLFQGSGSPGYTRAKLSRVNTAKKVKTLFFSGRTTEKGCELPAMSCELVCLTLQVQDLFEI